MISFSPPPNINLSSPSVWLATWFGSGFLSPAPGTWGSLTALPFGVVLFHLLGLWGFTIAITVIFLIGLWSAREFETATGEHDSKMVVIDEVVGQWIALLPVFYFTGIHWIWIIIAFALFRLFDISKPWPIAYCDKNIKGAWGVMIDDVLAGLAAAFILTGLFYAGFG